jgi:hypothetical protein
MKTIHLLWSITVVLAGILLAGCGGGSTLAPATGSTATIAGATFTVKWPERASRYIPSQANAIEVVITDGETEIARNYTMRPEHGGTSTINFPLLPAGTLTATAKAYSYYYPGEMMSQGVLAVGTGALVTHSHQVAAITLTMATTIDHLAIAPSAFLFSVGAQRNLTVTAVDATDAWVLQMPNQQLAWSYSTPGIVAVTAPREQYSSYGGLLKGLATGNVTVTATDTETGKAGTVTVTVRENATFPGTILAIINGKIDAYDVDGNYKYALDPNIYSINYLAASGDGKKLLIGSNYYDSQLLDFTTGQSPTLGGIRTAALNYDGTKIAYLKFNYYTYMMGLYIKDVTTNTTSLLTSVSSYTSADYAISPDGTMALITHEGQIFRVSVAAPSETYLVSGQAPVYTPDGESIIYLGTDWQSINMLDKDGQSTRLYSVTDGNNIKSLSVSPDGQYVFFIHKATIYRMKIDGSDVLPLVETGYYDCYTVTSCTDFSTTGMLHTTGTITVQ